MNFPFDIRKATEVAAMFIQKEPNSRLNVMKLVKLVYLLDRLSIAKRGIPVVGGVYYSMRNGPVTSELLEIINAGRLADEDDTSWERFISDRQGHTLEMAQQLSIEFLSPSELGLIEEIYSQHGAKNQWDLRDWCHKNCSEWTPLEGGREPIKVEEIAESVGGSEKEVTQIAREASESALLRSAFAASRSCA